MEPLTPVNTENLSELEALILAQLLAVDTNKVSRCAYLNGLATGACKPRALVELLRDPDRYTVAALAGYTAGLLLRLDDDLRVRLWYSLNRRRLFGKDTNGAS